MIKGAKKEKDKLLILIVEPFTKKRAQLIQQLKLLGDRNFEHTGDGAAAFNILKRRAVDIIISGWDMPNMNGLALLKVISADEELYRIPFFLAVPAVSRQMVIEAGKYGVSGVFVEPINDKQLDKKLTQIIEGSKSDPKAEQVEDLFQKAMKLFETGELDEALKVLNEIISVNESAEVYYNIGYIKTAQSKYDEAIVAFRKAVMIDNSHARAYRKMGDVYLKKGQPEQAEKYFEKAGEIFLERNMDKEAEDAFKEVLKISPDTTNIYNSLGIIYRRQNDYKKAIRQYQKAIEVDPEDENIYYNLGRALLEDKQIKEARKIFEHALKMNPDFKEAKRMIHAIDVGF